MKKEFAPFELAVKLKQLGFDEPCLSYYDKEENLRRSLLEYPVINSKNGFHHSYPIITAPLFQQAFRWFREEHGMAGIIDIGTQEYSFFIFDEKTDSRKVTSSMNGTYEEVELACLTKLIDFKSE
jgi:hypothetical protein